MTKSHTRRPTTRERELLEEIARLKRDAELSNAEYSRFDRALNELMRDVLRHVGDPLSHPTSINGGQLIQALEKAVRMIHDRQ